MTEFLKIGLLYEVRKTTVVHGGPDLFEGEVLLCTNGAPGQAQFDRPDSQGRQVEIQLAQVSSIIRPHFRTKRARELYEAARSGIIVMDFDNHETVMGPMEAEGE